MLVLRSGRTEHRIFCDLPEYLREGDLLVLNETRVIAARIFGKRPSGGRVEILLLRPSNAARYDPNATRWRALAKPARRLHPGGRVLFADFGEATVVAAHDDGVREFEFRLRVPFERFLELAGRLPMPPYIHDDFAEAQERYQTIFASVPGSVAAPTASLHFTQPVLDAIAARGVRIVKLVLDVGLGTFRPMQTETLDEHVMQSESFSIGPETAQAVARAKAQGGRVVAAGTTVARALEGSAAGHGAVRAGEGETSLFIKPGFRFCVIDALITNFHLPRSTLLALVCAFAGREAIFRAYLEAIRREYRFFSFGDAMYIEP